MADELRYLFSDADIVAVVHEPAHAAVLELIESDLPVPPVRLERGGPYERALAAASPARDFGPRSGDDLYVLYTGGTTGMPKGVLWRHEDLFFAALGGGNPGGSPIEIPEEIVERALRGRQRCLPASPFMHGAAHWFAWSMLLTGSTVVVATDTAFNPENLLDLVVAERVTFLVIVGDAFGRPIAEALEREPGRWDLSALTVVLSGGAVFSPSVKAELLARVPAAIVVDGFGASETGGHGRSVDAIGCDDKRPRFLVGEDTSVLDERMQPVKPGSGQVGRLARRGHVPLGYHKDAEKTALTFPVVDGVRWALPGDMAMVETDGTVIILGRGSVSINTGGEKVYPEEVESCLKAHPAVYDAVVVGVPDDRWGERVCAVVAPRSGQQLPTAASLADFCGDRLAGYKLPREVVGV
ncbi:MAG TPA: AMP-binding protein, partial [Acidimicrobiales bacterium]|nr:AMP-binding protein [Acidimicrobiales bacterium]